MEKRKGGQITVSGRHNDRTQPVPNADPERTHLNRVLYGDDRPTRELVTEVINEHGGKPRKDAVEAIEVLCKTSPQFFAEKDPQKFREKVDAFVEQAMQFLRDERTGGKLVKAVLHLDEHTPHIHAYKVPVDPEGKLNAKHFMRDREELERMQDIYYEYMKPLGLERGRRRSRATHERIEDFYKAIDAPVRLEVDHDEIPDPPKVLITEKERKKYKDKVIRAVLKGLEEPHKIMRDQAMLARHERGQREEAERKATERAAAAERAAQEQLAAVRQEEADRYDTLYRAATQILKDKGAVERENEGLRAERDRLNESLGEMTREKQAFELEARQYRERLSDILLRQVMNRMGYRSELRDGVYLYRNSKGEVSMRIEGQQAFDHQNRLICRNSIDLVVQMRRRSEGIEGFTQEQAIEFLREEFGDKRAAGAVMAQREQSVLEFFDRTRQERERERSLVPGRGHDPWRGPRGRAEDHDRGSRGGQSDDRGGRSGYSRGGR
jgi:hypothetical protein